MPKRKTKKRDLVGASSKNKIFLLLFIAIGIFFTLYKLNIFAASGGRGGGKVAPTPVPLPTPPAGELLLNTSFEYNTDADSRTPDGWVQHYDQPNKLVKVDCGVSVSGKCSYYVDGKHYNAIKQFQGGAEAKMLLIVLALQKAPSGCKPGFTTQMDQQNMVCTQILTTELMIFKRSRNLTLPPNQ